MERKRDGLTPEKRAARVEEIRANTPQARGTVPDDVQFLLAELDRVTAERDAAMDQIRSIEDLSEVSYCLYDGDTCGAVVAALEQEREERDAAIARAEKAERERDVFEARAAEYWEDVHANAEENDALRAQVAQLREALIGYAYADDGSPERCFCYDVQDGIHDRECIRARAALAATKPEGGER